MKRTETLAIVAPLYRIRECYISMIGTKDEQILELMRLVDKLTSK